MKTVLLWLGAVCLVAAVASPASAQSRIVSEQLNASVEMMRDSGLELEEPFRTGDLRDGEQTQLQVNLREGKAYIIVGVCDADCDDMDLVLADNSGTRIDSDLELDDVPMVTAMISQSGTYQLTVSMPSCSINPCGYGVAVFGGQP